MSRVKSEQVIETDRRIGQCLGAGMSVERAAEYLGVHPNTVRNHIDHSKQFIFTIKAEIETLLASQTAKTIVQIGANAEERIKGVFDRAINLTEHAIKKAEDMGDDITLEQLMDIHNKITVWSSRFTVSEAPKRLKLEGEVVQRHEVSGEVWDRLEMLERKMIPAGVPRALPVIDVPSGPAQRN